ncbi:MAG: sigma-70 family RNA polymerase sigma factor [Deltaproteobacteria bacterium]|nr:sigma-70 family RNA polymerase sigma factor [Deltaproteobacteria bacterium]
MQEARLRELYQRYGYHVFQRCRYLLADEDEAWDATQEVFLRAEQGMDGFAGRSSMLRWLLRIATNHCLNQLRAQRVRRGSGRLEPEALDREPMVADPSVGNAEAGERALLVRSLLAGFDQQTQAMALGYFVDEMSQEEVAEEVGLSVPTVRKRLRQFVERARRLLEQATPPVPRTSATAAAVATARGGRREQR